MAKDTLTTIADAVVTSLNAATFSQSFTAVRKRIPLVDLKDLETLHVTVTPRSITRAFLNRADTDCQFTADVSVQQQAETEAAADGLTYLTEEIADLFLGNRLTGYTTAICIGVTQSPAVREDHLIDKRAFTGVVALTFRVFR